MNQPKIDKDGKTGYSVVHMSCQSLKEQFEMSLNG